MANEIDRRVTEMQFDNAKFEEKIAQTVTSLDKLQKSLDFSNSSKGMGDLQGAASKMDFSHLTGAVDGIASKFSAMSLVAITALTNIVNKAVDSGVEIAKSLSVKPIMEGFKEYELNMGSIQTILSNTKDKGGNLQSVNEALDQLNTYSDKTIYNFGQMAKNIGTFTAAGVGLEESVKSIKGISNLAAISGSTSEQASTAMYQLSQALSAGKVNLMDWNSVVNAGMGGEVFKKALFETAKAMKTITDVPVGATFEQWEKQGGTFREQISNGFLTAEVLSTTLQGLSGDLDVAGLKAVGFGDKAAAKLVELGKNGIAAATEVKTMSQLMSTLKEGVASGWSASFRTIVGDFEQAKALFTEVNRVVGGALGKAADARNDMLKMWATLGGRATLLEGFRDAIGAVANIVNVVKTAFRDIFPPATVLTLITITSNFAYFAEQLRTFTEKIMPPLLRILKGLFAGIEIGYVVVKNIAELFVTLFKAIAPEGGAGKALDFFANLGDKLVALNELLVAGGGIERFFEKIEGWILNPREALGGLIAMFERFQEKFPSLASASDGLEQTMGRINSRFGDMNQGVEKAKDLWSSFTDIMDRVKATLDTVWGYISDWFTTLGDKLAAVMKPGDFSAATDVINVGLMGGIFLVIKRFFDKVLALEFGGGLREKIEGIFDIINEKAALMQTSIKADILIKIATAIGIMAASMLVLSLIDSGALTKALISIGVAFGILSTVLDRLKDLATSKTQIASMVAASAAMIGLSTAILILSAAVKVMSTIPADELLRGLGGVTVMLIALTAASNLIATNSKGMIAASIALTGLAVALTVVSAAVMAFGNMDMDVMMQGLLGISLALVALVAAVNVLPAGRMLAAGLAMIPLATGLTILAGAVALFGLLSWEEMGKGMFGLAVGLGIIAVAMHAMPLTLPITAAGLVLVAGAMTIMAGALLIMGSMSIDAIGRSLLALAGTMLILSAALIAMSGTLAGAAALVVAAQALVILATVLKVLGNMSLEEILRGLGALAGVLAVLGLAAVLLTPVIPALHALALALALIGGAFALFGAGVFLVAKGLETLAESGRAGATAFIEMMKIMVAGLPGVLGAIIASIAGLAGQLGAALGLIVRTVGTLLGHIIDTVKPLVPKIAALLVTIITTAIKSMTELIPAMIDLGFAFLMALLRGISDNIYAITTMGVKIITDFAKAITDNAAQIVDAGLLMLFSFINTIVDRSNEIVSAGFRLLVSFINGISNNLNKVVEAVGMLIATFIWTAGTYLGQIIRVGGDMIIHLIRGLGSKSSEIITAGVDVILEFLAGIGSNAVRLAEGAANVLIDFLNGMATAIRTKSDDIRKAGLNIADAILDGITGGLTSMANLRKVVDAAKGLATKVVDGFKEVIPFASPSPLFIQIGKWIIDGLTIGLKDSKASELAAAAGAEKIVSVFTQTLERIPDTLGDIKEFNPTIVPVLDLSNVYSGAAKLDRLMRMSTITPGVSFEQARNVATTKELDETSTDEPELPRGDVIFNQNNYSPEALRAHDIYRNTRSQFAKAKEELGIPS